MSFSRKQELRQQRWGMNSNGLWWQLWRQQVPTQSHLASFRAPCVERAAQVPNTVEEAGREWAHVCTQSADFPPEIPPSLGETLQYGGVVSYLGITEPCLAPLWE